MRIASANEAALRQLQLGLVGVNLAALLIRYALSLATSRRALPGFWTSALHLIATASTVGVWRWFVAVGAPRRDGAGGVRVGEDLGGKGVIEMAWDAVYMTWICTLGSALLGNWVWLLYLLFVPGLAAYKLFSTVRPLLAMFLPGLFGARGGAADAGHAGAAQQAQAQEPGESRKQAKLRARMERGDKRVQAMQRG